MPAVDGKDVIALGDVDPRLVEGRPCAVVPAGAADDRRDPVSVAVDFPVHAEEPRRPLGGRFEVDARPAEDVGAVQLADHLADDEAHIPAGHRVVEESQVAVPKPLPVDLVQLRVVEEVAVEAPTLQDHLPPFGRGLDPRLHSIRGQLRLDGLVGAEIDDGEVVVSTWTRSFFPPAASCREPASSRTVFSSRSSRS